MTVEVAQSSGSKPATTDAVANIMRWFVEICATAKYFFRARRFASAERAESAALEPGAVATAPIPAHAEVELDVRTNRVAHTELDQQEIERRRNLVRTLFNDFWNGAYEKPAAFVERLDQAEDYLNERLAGSGEFWLLVFVSERGAPLTAPAFSRMVERAAVSARLGIKAHAHKLRHACG